MFLFASHTAARWRTSSREGLPLHAAAGCEEATTAKARKVTEKGDATAPAFSTLPFPADRTRSLLVFVSLSSDGKAAVQAAVAGNGTVHLLLDVMGYFE